MRFTLKNMMLCIAIAAVSLAFYTPVWLFPGLIALLETLRREVAGLQAEVQRPRRENNELCQDAGCWRRRHRDVRATDRQVGSPSLVLGTSAAELYPGRQRMAAIKDMGIGLAPANSCALQVERLQAFVGESLSSVPNTPSIIVTFGANRRSRIIGLTGELFPGANDACWPRVVYTLFGKGKRGPPIRQAHAKAKLGEPDVTRSPL